MLVINLPTAKIWDPPVDLTNHLTVMHIGSCPPCCSFEDSRAKYTVGKRVYRAHASQPNLRDILEDGERRGA